MNINRELAIYRGFVIQQERAIREHEDAVHSAADAEVCKFVKENPHE